MVTVTLFKGDGTPMATYKDVLGCSAEGPLLTFTYRRHPQDLTGAQVRTTLPFLVQRED